MTARQEKRIRVLLIKAFSCCGGQKTAESICFTCVETISKVGALISRWEIPRPEYLSLAREIKKDYAPSKEW